MTNVAQGITYSAVYWIAEPRFPEIVSVPFCRRRLAWRYHFEFEDPFSLQKIVVEENFLCMESFGLVADNLSGNNHDFETRKMEILYGVLYCKQSNLLLQFDPVNCERCGAAEMDHCHFSMPGGGAISCIIYLLSEIITPPGPLED